MGGTGQPWGVPAWEGAQAQGMHTPRVPLSPEPSPPPPCPGHPAPAAAQGPRGLGWERAASPAGSMASVTLSATRKATSAARTQECPELLLEAQTPQELPSSPRAPQAQPEPCVRSAGALPQSAYSPGNKDSLFRSSEKNVNSWPVRHERNPSE